MIGTGFTLALLTGIGFFFLYSKLPRRIRKFMAKHILLTDSITCMLTYLLFGGTLVALFAAAWLSIIISIILLMMQNPELQRMTEKLTAKLIEMKDVFIRWLGELSSTKEEKTIGP